MNTQDLLNQWTVLILGIWFASAAAAALTREGKVMMCALYATVLIGLGYLILRGL